jgi:hypothetical protein
MTTVEEFTKLLARDKELHSIIGHACTENPLLRTALLVNLVKEYRSPSKVD